MNTLKVIKACLYLLKQDQRKKYILVVFAQFLTGILDLAAVAAMGILSLAAVTSKEKQNNSGIVTHLLIILRSKFTDEHQLLIYLTISAILLFLIKSIFSLYFSRRILRFLSNQAVSISTHMFERFTKQSLIFIQKHSSQQVVESLGNGISASILGILGSTSILMSELGLMTILTLGLFIVDPLLTIFAIGYFALIVLLLQRGLTPIAIRAGRARSQTEIQTIEIIQETVASFREIYVADKTNFIITKFAEIRSRGAKSMADSQWVNLIPKYTMESSLIIGAGLLGAYQLTKHDPTAAVGSLTIFLAAGSRILPSILRIQGALSALQSYMGSSEYSFRLIAELEIEESLLKDSEPVPSRKMRIPQDAIFIPELAVNSIKFTYPGKNIPAIMDVSFFVPSGSSLAIVGSTGSGKSTLADLILGLIRPTTGSVTLSGVDPRLAIKIWPEKVAYVPQVVALSNSTIRENVALGRNPEDIDDSKVWMALEKAQLSEFIKSTPEGLDTKIGENGVKLSGGQRQRLGLARALHGNPQILILDEATSSLDAETENAISETLKNLKGEITLIVIAHRLATIRAFDNLIYLSEGTLLAQGTFIEVRKRVPQLDNQANLLGI